MVPHIREEQITYPGLAYLLAAPFADKLHGAINMRTPRWYVVWFDSRDTLHNGQM
jgi:hypothetical protein